MSFEPDYNRLDPDDRYKHYLALGSVSLGVISLVAGLVPICGEITSLLGFILGLSARKSSYRKLAYTGIAISILGFMIAVTYQLIVFLMER